MSEEHALQHGVPKERRFKLSRACDRCRRRRIKCDEGHPCQSCLSANSACTFEEPGKRSHPHKSKRTATLEDRMANLEALIQGIPPSVIHSTAAPLPAAFPSSTSLAAALGSGTVDPSTTLLPLGVPPPSLSTKPLINPSTHFPGDDIADAAARLSLSPSYLYLDDEGATRWQGETSGLPLIDLLRERDSPASRDWSNDAHNTSSSVKQEEYDTTWFPDRTPKRVQIDPQVLWKLITSAIPPDLMDSLVQCFLSTTYWMMPFLHVPTFLSDYGDPQKWGETGFVSFILAVCCLSSRHVDDPRVRADPADPSSAGSQWFSLFLRMRMLPNADRPTLYTVQSVFVAAVYAIGCGKLSKAFALLAEAATLSVDAGLHRRLDGYDCFDTVQDEVRKRTFWCVYSWDKHAGAVFGRPPVLRLRDCDVSEPACVDDEFIHPDTGVGVQPPGTEPRIGAFIATLRLFVVLESVLDMPPPVRTPYAPFLAHASEILSGFHRHRSLREEEALLDDVCARLPAYWAHTPETLASQDVIRITQAERISSLEQFVRMLIHRYRFSTSIATAHAASKPGSNVVLSMEDVQREKDELLACQRCAVHIVTSHLHTQSKGLMVYYGVHVIHQLTQAGRTLVAVLLDCKSDDTNSLIQPTVEALRNCVVMLRRFSSRYLCGLRSADLIEEICRLSRIPIGPATPSPEGGNESERPPWIRPVRKRQDNSRSRSAASGYESSDSPNPDHKHPHPGAKDGRSPDSSCTGPFAFLSAPHPPDSSSGGSPDDILSQTSPGDLSASGLKPFGLDLNSGAGSLVNGGGGGASQNGAASSPFDSQMSAQDFLTMFPDMAFATGTSSSNGNGINGNGASGLDGIGLDGFDFGGEMAALYGRPFGDGASLFSPTMDGSVLPPVNK